jgi:hypothetical protein
MDTLIRAKNEVVKLGIFLGLKNSRTVPSAQYCQNKKAASKISCLPLHYVLFRVAYFTANQTVLTNLTV